MICILDGHLALRPYGLSPPSLTLGDDAPPLVARLRDVLWRCAPGLPARILIENAGGAAREATGPWKADWTLGGCRPGQPLNLYQHLTVGDHDLLAYLTAVARRRPHCPVRITISPA